VLHGTQLTLHSLAELSCSAAIRQTQTNIAHANNEADAVWQSFTPQTNKHHTRQLELPVELVQYY
jgi:hypothetical protein